MILRIALILALSLCIPANAFAKRIAFVVGVDKFDNLSEHQQLKKAIGDASAMKAMLEARGNTSITYIENPTNLAFWNAWDSFLAQVAADDEVFIHISSHGVEIDGSNYLLARDTSSPKLGKRAVLQSSIRFGDLLGALSGKEPGLSVIVLDACRENPFARDGTRGIGAERGLKREEPPRGAFIIYSAGLGETALDRLSDGEAEPTSVFTRTLLPLLKTPGLSIQGVALNAAEDVSKLALTVPHEQNPAYFDNLKRGRGTFCFAGCDGGGQKVAEIAPPPEKPAEQPVAVKPVETPKPASGDADAPRQLVRTFAGHTGPVFGAAFSGDGRFAYSVGEHGIVRTWDVATGAAVRTFTLPLDFHFNGDARSAAFSRDGRYVLLGGRSIGDEYEKPFRSEATPLTPAGYGGRLILVDLVRGELDSSVSALKLGRTVESVGISPNGKFAIVATRDKVEADDRPRRPNESAAQYITRLREPVSQIADLREPLVPRGDQVHEVLPAPQLSFIDELSILEIAYGQQFRTLEQIGPLKEQGTGYGQLAFSPDGRKVVATNGDAIKIFDAAATKLLTTISLKKLLAGCPPKASRPLNSLSLSADGKLIAGAFSPCTYTHQWDVPLRGDSPKNITADQITIKFWDAATGGEIGDGEKFENVALVAFAPKGRFIAIGGSEGRVLIFDTQNRTLGLDTVPRTPSSEYRWITTLAFSPDGRFLLSGSYDKSLKLWDVSEWTQPQEARR
jgi:WD40 repeat protein